MEKNTNELNANILKGHKKFSRKTKGELVFCLLMLLVPMVQFIVFWGYVNFDSIMMGFKDATENWSLVNFERFINEVKKGTIQIAFKNSLINLAVAEFITLPLVVIFSYLLYKRCYGASVFRIVFFLPSLISAVVMANLFINMVTPVSDNNLGPIVIILEKTGVNFSREVLRRGLLSHKDTAFGMIMVYCVWTGMGTNLILLAGALARSPQELFEAANIDGAGMFTEFAHVVVPLIWPTITTLFIFNLAGCFTMYMPVMLLTNGDYETMTIGYYITASVMNSGGDLSTLGYPAMVGIVFTVITVPIILVVKWAFNKISEAVEF